MPIQTPSKAVVPLSSYWTHEGIVTLIRQLTGELDSTTLQNYTIRTFVNAAITQIAEMLRLANEPFYSIMWEGTIEAANAAGLQWIDLATPVTNPTPTALTGERPFHSPSPLTANNFIPLNMLASIERVTGIVGPAQTAVAANVMVTNCKKANIADLVTLSGNHNDSYRQSILWCWHSDRLMLFHGAEIDTTPTGALAAGTYYKRPERYTIWGTRLPLIDNMQPSSVATSSYEQLIDIPDRHVRLLALMVQKQVLESMQKQLDQAAVAELQMLTSQITQNIIQAPQVEAVQHESAKSNTGL